jgi:septum formation protein
MRWILASGSPRRRDLLTALGRPFEVLKSDIDETQQTGESPLDYVERMALEKSAAVRASLESPDKMPTVVIAADTIVIAPIGDVVLGKPADGAEARATLNLLRGQTHTVATAVSITLLDSGMTLTLNALCTTHVTMRDYADVEIDAYIATGDPFDKAGAYAIQHADFAPVEAIDGCYSNVVGFPLCAVREILGDLGLADPDDGVCDCPNLLQR